MLWQTAVGSEEAVSPAASMQGGPVIRLRFYSGYTHTITILQDINFSPLTPDK